MGFKDRLREKRVEANLTQAALAEKVSVTARTIQNYELGSRKPTKYEVVKKIAEALNTTPEYLLGNSGMLVLAAQEQGGAKAAREIDELVSEVSGMFAGAVSVKTRWTARCRLSPEPTGLQKKRTRSTRRKSTGKIRRKSKSGFWYRLFDIMVIPEGRWRDERRTTIKSRQRSRPTLRHKRSFPDCKRAGYQRHGRLRKSRITQGYVLHRQKKPLHLSQ